MAKDFLVRTGTGIDDVEYQSLDYLPIAGGTITGELNVPAPTKDSNAATKKYVDDYATSHSGFVKKTGDTMSGTLNMSDNLISGLKTPAANTDAATKKYVDDKAADAKSAGTAAQTTANAAKTAAASAKTTADNAQSTANAAKSTADANATKIGTINTTLAGLEWINQYKALIEKLAAVAHA